MQTLEIKKKEKYQLTVNWLVAMCHFQGESTNVCILFLSFYRPLIPLNYYENNWCLFGSSNRPF